MYYCLIMVIFGTGWNSSVAEGESATFGSYPLLMLVLQNVLIKYTPFCTPK